MPNQERTFTVDGETYALRFTHGALCRLEHALGKPPTELHAQPGPDELQALVLYGLEGARLKYRSGVAPIGLARVRDLIEGVGESSMASLAFEALTLALPSKLSRRAQEEMPESSASPQDWDQLLADAMELGLKPDEFWNMTPKELAMYAGAQARRVQTEIRRSLATAWNIASLVRAAQLPSLSQVLGVPDSAQVSEEELTRRRDEFKQATETMMPNGRSNG
jgi:hypothetical protein